MILGNGQFHSTDMEVGAVRFSDCKMKDGVTGRQAFDAYKDFAIAARSKGDNLGRKMIFLVLVLLGAYDYVSHFTQEQ